MSKVSVLPTFQVFAKAAPALTVLMKVRTFYIGSGNYYT